MIVAVVPTALWFGSLTDQTEQVSAPVDIRPSREGDAPVRTAEFDCESVLVRRRSLGRSPLPKDV